MSDATALAGSVFEGLDFEALLRAKAEELGREFPPYPLYWLDALNYLEGVRDLAVRLLRADDPDPILAAGQGPSLSEKAAAIEAALAALRR